MIAIQMRSLVPGIGMQHVGIIVAQLNDHGLERQTTERMQYGIVAAGRKEREVKRVADTPILVGYRLTPGLEIHYFIESGELTGHVILIVERIGLHQ